MKAINELICRLKNFRDGMSEESTMTINALVDIAQELKIIKNSNNQLIETTKKISLLLQYNLLDFDKLKTLLESNDWPEAAISEFICKDEQEKIKRAKSIVESLINQPFTNKKFLDYGCGEGHVVKYVIKHAEFALGYDIEKQNWGETNFLTTNNTLIHQKGKYDIIMLYDVIDHAEDPVEVMNDVASLLEEDGTIYVRCHPWYSRHGGHMYHKLNKAFINLIFTEDELKKLNLLPDKSNNINEYEPIFKEVELKIKDKSTIKGNVENFFKKEIIAKRISQRIEEEKLGINFIDYQLVKSN